MPRPSVALVVIFGLESPTLEGKPSSLCHIEGAALPRRFQQPTFTIYNGNTDPVEHVSQFNQRMAVHSKNEALMCKVFPSSLGPMVMRWFNGLKANSVDSYRQLTQAFGSRFVTNSRAPQPLSALLSLSIRNGETLKTYSGRYWEMYNEMDGNFNDITINTFKSSLPAEHGLRKSLTGKPATSVRQLIDRIDKYKRGEEHQFTSWWVNLNPICSFKVSTLPKILNILTAHWMGASQKCLR